MKKNQKWFTLIELLIVITISFILMTLTFANYNYYQNVAKVKLGAKEVSQSISESRNAAIAWWQKDGINQKVGVYFEQWKSDILYYNFAFNSGAVIAPIYLMKQEKLPDGVSITSSGTFIVFSSVFGTGWIYDTSWKLLSEKDAVIELTYKNATSSNLKRQVKYNSVTNTIDY